MSSIKLVALKTNHILIADTISHEFEDFVTIKKPAQTVMQPGPNGMGSLMMVPFCEFSTEFSTGFHIKKSDILFVTTPIVELENQYNEVFGSGITIASTIPTIR